MKLITADIQKKLEKNYEKAMETGESGDVVLKLFAPWGSATWLITDIDPDGDRMMGLCDLGMGFCEFGSVSLSELQSVTGPFGLKVERDRFFTGGPVKKFIDYYNEHNSLAGC